MSIRIYCGLTAIAGISTTLGIAYLYTGTKPSLIFLPGRLGYAALLAQVVFYIQNVWSIVRWMAYQPTKTIEDDDVLPTITIVVPAYNESRFIRHALQAILHSDYPKAKMSVTVVDDGSTDDTWSHITSMASTFEDAKVRYEPYRHDTNLGKRYAICTGLRHARGEVIVSLDSDSILEVCSLRNIASPFVHDPRVGGVAGHLTALNVGGAVLPRLLDILFDTSGNIPRSAQSHSGGFVTILPGALSAYRLCAVHPLIDGLCNSRFLGRPLKHGEDVELTLGLLQAGWSTTYQSNAVIQTVAPETCTRAFLMYTRWERSSYVYMLRGYSQMAMSRVLQSLREQLAVLTATVGSGKQRAPLDGSLYMLLSLFCTAVGNPILFATSIYQVYLVWLYPEALKVAIPVMMLLPYFQAALFFADACAEPVDDEPKDQACDKTKGDTAQHSFTCGTGDEQVNTEPSCCDGATSPTRESPLYNKRSRLAWRLQYGGLAGLFNAVVISCSSIVALTTLRSQKWLTR
ncbi:hyaluronan synthase [Microdochium nivale]|nr:hyaluronan synthase [Microdochium nivale]